VHVTGNMKFDNIPIHPSEERQRYFADLLGTSDGVPLIVGGSTHPGEEAALARIHLRLRERGLSCRLLVAPRHPGRAEHVEHDLRREGGKPRRRSRLEGGEKLAADEIVILDSVGELEVVYSLARAVFVGGTLVPHGGHNVMEPSSLGRPVVVGPHFANFRGEVELLERARGLVCAGSEAEVEATLGNWIRSEEAAADVGRHAREAIDRSKGATERTLLHIRSVLEAAGMPTASA
jgi:3-deoxy-D-manno-octulosonic-acid transferase